MFRIKTTSVMLVLLCCMYFIAFLDRVNISMASTAFGPELGLSNTQIGFVISVFALPYLLFQVIGGSIGDKIGPRWTLTASVVIVGMATLAIGFAGGLASMVVARIVLGIGEGATFPVATSAVARWFSSERRGRVQGLTHACARLGNAVCPPIVAFLMGLTSWRGSFIVIGLITFVWAAIWFWYYRDDPHKHPNITADELKGLPSSVSAARPTVPMRQLALRMLPVGVVYFSYGWVLWVFLGWMPQYFLHNFQLNIGKSALFASTVFLAGVVGDVVGGYVTDGLFRRSGSLLMARRNLVIAGLLGSLLSLVSLIFVHDLLPCVILLSLGLFFCEVTVGPMWAIPIDIAPEYSGTATGLMCVGGSLGAFLSPLTSGFLIDQTGSWTTPFLCPIILLLIGLAFTFRMRPDRRFTPRWNAQPNSIAATKPA